MTLEAPCETQTDEQVQVVTTSSLLVKMHSPLYDQQIVHGLIQSAANYQTLDFYVTSMLHNTWLAMAG